MVPVLGRHLSLDPHSVEQRLAVLRSASKIGGIRGVRALLDGLDDPSWDVRARSIEYLALRRGTSIDNGLGRGLGDSDEMVRIAAVEAIGDRRSRKFLPLLVEMLESEPDYLVRASVAYSLGQIGGSKRALLAALACEDVDAVRLRILCALGMNGHPGAYLAALQYLESPDYRTRCAAVNLLSDLASGDVRETLGSMLVCLKVKDPSLAVRDTAHRALLDLSGDT